VRRPIVVNWTSFDLGQVTDRITEVAQELAAYLDSFNPEGGARSKHALMGPVAKVFASARGALLVPEDLLGLAIRVHEQTSRDQGRALTTEHRRHLEEGIRRLVELLNEVPEAARSDIIGSLDHSVYWLRKKAQLKRYERVHQEFRDYLRAKYGDDEGLREAWGETAVDTGWTLDTVPYPSRNLESHKGRVGSDVTEFWRLRREREPEQEGAVE